MQRKVIQLAGKTLVLSLPSKWVKSNGVLKGDELEIELQENALTISTEKEKRGEKVTLNTEDKSYFDPLTVAYLYQAGIDEIEIHYKDREVYKQIQEKIPDLMGYEIVNQGQNHIEIKNITTALEEEFDTILRRTFYLLEEMGRNSLEAIKKQDYEKLKDTLELENSVDKFTDFCKRVLTKRGHQRKTQFHYVIIRDLEKIGDNYEEIARQTLEAKTKISKETIELYEEANKYLALFHQLFYKYSKEKAEEFQQKKKELKTKTKTIMNTAKKEELLIAYNLASLIKLISNLYGPYYITTL